VQTLKDVLYIGLISKNRLSQSILAKAFRGDLVPQDPNDEPAEKLLERIRRERLKHKGKKIHGRSSHELPRS